MSLDFQDPKQNKLDKFGKTFHYAFQGIKTTIFQEKNMKIHLVFSVFAILMGIILSISMIEWVCILLLIGGVLALETLNSAIERVVDLVTAEYHPLAKQAKDMAAGAVLILAIVAVVVGVLIFGPKLIAFL